MITYNRTKKRLYIPYGLNPYNGEGTARFQTKEVTISSPETEVVPDSGYDGMVKVTIDAQDYTDEVYDEGYYAGIDEQKSKLADKFIVQSGTYTREDGWKKVTVAVPVPLLQDERNYEVERYGTGQGTVLPEGGAAAMKKVKVDATLYGGERYRDGYDVGYDTGVSDGIQQTKEQMVTEYISENGTYNDSHGYKQVVVDVQGITSYDTTYARAIQVPPGVGYKFTDQSTSGYYLHNYQRIDFEWGIDELPDINNRIHLMDNDEDGGASVSISHPDSSIIHLDINNFMDDDAPKVVDISSLTFPIKIKGTYDMYNGWNKGAVIITDSNGVIMSESWNMNQYHSVRPNGELNFFSTKNPDEGPEYYINQYMTTFDHFKVYELDHTTLTPTEMSHYVKYSAEDDTLKDIVGNWGTATKLGEGDVFVVNY